jgi:hypothetical protein
VSVRQSLPFCLIDIGNDCSVLLNRNPMARQPVEQYEDRPDSRPIQSRRTLLKGLP